MSGRWGRKPGTRSAKQERTREDKYGGLLEPTGGPCGTRRYSRSRIAKRSVIFVREAASDYIARLLVSIDARPFRMDGSTFVIRGVSK